MGAVATMEEGSTCSRRGDGRLGAAAARPFAAIGRSATTACVLVLPLLVVMLLGSTPLPVDAFTRTAWNRLRRRKVERVPVPDDGAKVWLVMSMQKRRWYGGGMFNLVYKLRKDDQLPARGYTTVRMNCPAYRPKKRNDFNATKRNVQKCRKAAEKFVEKKTLGRIARQTFEVEESNAPLLYNVDRQKEGDAGRMRFNATDNAAGDFGKSTALFYTCQKPGDLDKKSSLCLGGKGFPKFFPGLESQYHKRFSSPSIVALHSYMESSNLKTDSYGHTTDSYIVFAEPQAQGATSGEANGGGNAESATRQMTMLVATKNEGGLSVLVPFIPESERPGNGNVLFIHHTKLPPQKGEQQQTEEPELLRSGGQITTRRVSGPMQSAVLGAYEQEKARIQNLTHVYVAGSSFPTLMLLVEHFEKQKGDNSVKYRFVQDESPATPEEFTAPLSAALWPSYAERPKVVYRHTRVWKNSHDSEPHSVGTYKLTIEEHTWRIIDMKPDDLMSTAWPNDVADIQLSFGESGMTVKYHYFGKGKDKTIRLPNFQSLTLERVNQSLTKGSYRYEEPPSSSQELPKFAGEMQLAVIKHGFTKLSFAVESKTKAVRSTEIFVEPQEAGTSLGAGGHSSDVSDV